MDRVTFLMDETGTLLECLLNPERLVIHRESGITDIHSVHGKLTGTGTAHTPILFQGGGITELELYLLFDLSLQTKSTFIKDVRQMTKPLWDLTNSSPTDPYTPAIVRFIWGKSWNIPGVVLNLSEHLEQFTPSGIPQRSWLSMRFRQVAIPSTLKQQPSGTKLQVSDRNVTPLWVRAVDTLTTHLLVGGKAAFAFSSQRWHDTESLIQQMLASTGLGAYIQHSINSTQALLKDLWGLIANGSSSISQHLQAAWDKTQAFLVDVGRSSGEWLLRQYSKMKATLEGLTAQTQRFLTESVIPFGQDTLQGVRQILNNIKQQAQAAWITSRNAFSQLKKAAVTACVAGANGLRHVAASITHSSGVAMDYAVTIGSDLYHAIAEALHTVLNTAHLMVQKSVDWLVKPLLEQLSKLPPLIQQAWKTGNKPAARWAEQTLDTALQSVQSIKVAASSLQLAENHAPVRQAKASVEQLAATLSTSVVQQDTVLIQEQIAQLADNIAHCPVSAAQTVVQGTLAALQLALPVNSPTTASRPAPVSSPVTELLSRLQEQLVSLEEQQQQHHQQTLAQALQQPSAAAATVLNTAAVNTERLDQLAYKYYGNPSWWRKLAYANAIMDPLRLPGNLALQIPAGEPG